MNSKGRVQLLLMTVAMKLLVTDQAASSYIQPTHGPYLWAALPLHKLVIEVDLPPASYPKQALGSHWQTCHADHQFYFQKCCLGTEMAVLVGCSQGRSFLFLCNNIHGNVRTSRPFSPLQWEFQCFNLQHSSRQAWSRTDGLLIYYVKNK